MLGMKREGTDIMNLFTTHKLLKTFTLIGMIAGSFPAMSMMQGMPAPTGIPTQLVGNSYPAGPYLGQGGQQMGHYRGGNGAGNQFQRPQTPFQNLQTKEQAIAAMLASVNTMQSIVAQNPNDAVVQQMNQPLAALQQQLQTLDTALQNRETQLQNRMNHQQILNQMPSAAVPTTVK
jgi:hypothetical protein